MNRKRTEKLYGVGRRLTLLMALAFLAAAPPAVQEPEILWTHQFGSPSDETIHGISGDYWGNLFVAGGVNGSLPGQIPAGKGDAFVRWYDAEGNEVRTLQFGTSEDDAASAVRVDESGHVVVAGWTRGSLDGTTFPGGATDAFVRKYDTEGKVEWTEQFAFSSFNVIYSVTTDHLDNVIVAGVTLSFSGDYNSFVRKYDKDGHETWTRFISTPDDEYAFGVSADIFGNIFVAGQTSGELTGQTSAGNTDAFLIKYNAAGAVLWTRQFGSSGDDSATSVSANSSGHIFVAGGISGAFPGQTSTGSGDAFLRKYDEAGNVLWTRQFGTSAWDVAHSVATDGSGNVVAAGETEGAFPGQTSAGDRDVFVRMYDAAGNELWTRQLGTPAMDLGKGVCTDGLGNSYVAGGVGGALATQTHGGALDAFVAKIGIRYFPPVADAGPDRTIECKSPGGVLVTLDGTKSFDPDGSLTAAYWFSDTWSTSGMVTQVFLPVGRHEIYLLVVDDSGRQTVDLVIITVVDIDPPVLTLPANVQVEQLALAGTPVTLTPPNAFDLVEGAVLVTHTPEVLPAVFPLGSTDIVWSATDHSGNVATATSTVTVVDTTAPLLGLHEVYDVAESIQTFVTIVPGPWMFGTPGNFTSNTLRIGGAGSNLYGWGDFDRAPFIVRTLTDRTYQFQKEVHDILGIGSATIPSGLPDGRPWHPGVLAFKADSVAICRWKAPHAGSFDISGEFLDLLSGQTRSNVAIRHNSQQIFSGEINGPDGILKQPFQITRSVRKDDTVDFVVTAQSNKDFSITALTGKIASPLDPLPPSLTIEQQNKDGTSASALTMFGARDVCDANVKVTVSAPATLAPGTTIVHLTATDASGNTVQTDIPIVVVDRTAPVVSATPFVTVEQNTLGGTQMTLPSPFVKDAVDPIPTITSDAPAIFPLGLTQVTYTATDASNNVGTATTTVIVRDTIGPLGGSYDVAESIQTFVTFVPGPWMFGTPGNFTSNTLRIGGAGSNIYGWGDFDRAPFIVRTLTDQTYQFHKEVNDFLGLSTGTIPSGLPDGRAWDPGVLAFKADPIAICRWKSPYTGQFEVSGEFLDLLRGQTRSSVAIYHNSQQIFSGVINGPDGILKQPFQITRSVRKDDTLDFVVSASNKDFSITALAGSINPPTIPVTVEQSKSSGTPVTLPIPFDVCDARPEVVHNAPAVFPLGTTVVPFTATDASGNRTVGSYTVRVVDTTPPVLSNVPGDVSVETTDPTGVSMTLISPTATDICDVDAKVTSDAPLVFPLGTTTVTFTATDASGNHDTASTKVTVRKIPKITWANPIGIFYGIRLGQQQLNATADVPGTFVYSPPADTALQAGLGQSLSVAFTPTDPDRYVRGSATVLIDVLQAPLTIRARSATKVYGAPLPSFSAVFIGFVFGDTPPTALDGKLRLSTTAIPESPVGTYPITPDGFDSNRNYRIIYENGTLTVTPAPLTVKADDQIKTLGAANPTLTATYTGLVSGDTSASLDSPVVLSTTATTSSPIGEYPITASGAADPNYKIMFLGGILKIQYAGTGTVNGEPGHQALQPINPDGTSVFKQGSNVKIRFRVADANGNSIGTSGLIASFLQTQVISGTTVTGVNEPVDSTNGDTAFRWDGVSQQWGFNLSTKSLTAGNTYVYRITLNDGSFIEFRFGLK